MSIFRSEKTGFLKVEVTKDGLIKTVQVKKLNDGSIPSVPYNDSGKVFSKDIPASTYKGLIYAMPMTSENFITISYPSLMANKFKVEKRDLVKLD